MSPPQQLRQQTSNCSLLLIYRPRKDERLSWPSWLTYSGWFTHVSGHPSATGRAQDSESTLARPMFYRWTTQPVYRGRNINTFGYCYCYSLHAAGSDEMRTDLYANWALCATKTKRIFASCNWKHWDSAYLRQGTSVVAVCRKPVA